MSDNVIAELARVTCEEYYGEDLAELLAQCEEEEPDDPMTDEEAASYNAWCEQDEDPGPGDPPVS